MLFGLSSAALLEPLIRNYWTQNPQLIFLYQTLISTAIVLFLAEYTPKLLFRQDADRKLRWVTYWIYATYKLFQPLVYAIERLYQWIHREQPSKEHLFTEEELQRYLLDTLTGFDPIKYPGFDTEIFENVLAFDEILVKEFMKPRTEIVAISIDQSPEEAYQVYKEHPFTRFPVYKEKIDYIVGYIEVTDLLKPPKDLRAILRKVVVVPETMPAHLLLQEFKQQQCKIAIVVDEYGITAGLVTMEDLLEEIFGELMDEFDEEEEEWSEEVLGPNHYRLSTRLEVSYVNKKYHLNIPESDQYTTLAGWLMELFGEIPAEGAEIQFQDLKIKVAKSSPQQVQQIEIWKIHED